MDKNKPNLIFDFDSTFVKVEALDELAAIALADREDKDKIVSEIKRITNLGMEGVISFPESLVKRFKLLSARKEHVDKLIGFLQDNISESIKKNKDFFKTNNNNIYIISGGFSEYICPVVADFGIKPKNVLANEFVMDKTGNILGFNKEKNMSKTQGKVREVMSLSIPGKIWIIGDGYTDYQIREMGAAEKFVAFCENVRREPVLEKADQVVNDFDEFLALNNL